MSRDLLSIYMYDLCLIWAYTYLVRDTFEYWEDRATTSLKYLFVTQQKVDQTSLQQKPSACRRT